MIIDKFQGIRSSIIVIGAAFLIGHLCFWLLPDVFVTWNTRTVDRLFLLRSSLEHLQPHYDDTVVHVDLNNRSIRQLNNFYLDRSYHAQVIRNLTAMNVAEQLYDFIFAARSHNEADAALIDAVRKADNVFFGMAFELVNKGQPDSESAEDIEGTLYLERTKWHVATNEDATTFFSGANPLITFTDLANVSRGLGCITVEADRDGVFRRLPLLVRYGENVYPSLVLRAVCHYLGVPPEQVAVEPGKSVTLKNAVRPGERSGHDIIIPIDRQGRMIINFIGPWGAMKHYDFVDVFRAAEDRERLEIWREELSGKVVLISETLTGASDVGPTPTDGNFPLSGIHANAIHTILTESFLSELSDGIVFLIESALLAAIFFLSLRFSSLAFSFGTLALAGSYACIAVFSFLYMNVIFQIVRPLLMMTFALIFLQVVRALESANMQAEIRKNMELAERELVIGRKIQSGFLPESLPTAQGWEIVAHFQAARYVAGDFYDVFELEEKQKVAIVLADVCDKGVGAALFMALFRSLIRAFAIRNFSQHRSSSDTFASNGDASLQDTIEQVNDYIATTHSQANMFATLFLGFLDLETGSLEYVNAGHEPPFIIRDTIVRDRLTPTGPAVGMMPNLNFTIRRTELKSGEILFVYTDGVTDAQSRTGELFTRERLLAKITESSHSAKQLMDCVRNGLCDHISGAHPYDDITILAVQRKVVS